jgi:hypothetical protein
MACVPSGCSNNKPPGGRKVCNGSFATFDQSIT